MSLQLQYIINKAKAHNPSIDTIQIQIVSHGDSYKVQKVLFNNGIYWPGESTPNFSAANARFLYIYLNDRPMSIRYSMVTTPHNRPNYYTVKSTALLQNTTLKRIH